MLVDGASLDAYLESYPNVVSEQDCCPPISLETWQSLGEDADEPAYSTAQRLGLPVVASPAQIRAAIARHYDEVEDRAMARQLGIDISLLAEQSPSEQEAHRLALKVPVVRMVHNLIADAVTRPRSAKAWCQSP